MYALLALFIVVLIIGFVASCLAYSEGKYDGSRKRYDNVYWLPLAYVYDFAYNRWEGREKLSTARKNHKRFNRE